jgi:pimeloyl-ACP methyl ester carboxylesterase
MSAGDLGFVLVHGGGHDGRCWDKLVPHLAGPALAVDLPGRGSQPADLRTTTIADFVDSTVAQLDAWTETERVVLVGHSMAGVSIPTVAARRPDRVAHLVFVACFLPREGGTIVAELPTWIRVMATVGAWRGRRSGAPPTSSLSPRMAIRMFGHDMDEEQRAFLLSHLVPEAPGITFEAVSRQDLPPADVIPRTYVKLLQDRTLRPKLQDQLIANLGSCAVRTLDSGHDAMISHPVELSAVLNGIAASTSP